MGLDIAHWLGSINGHVHSVLFVVVDERNGHLMVLNQSFPKDVFVVIGTADQCFSGDVILHRNLRWLEFEVVTATGSDMKQAPGDAANKQIVGDVELDDCVERRLSFLKNLVELKSESSNVFRSTICSSLFLLLYSVLKPSKTLN